MVKRVVGMLDRYSELEECKEDVRKCVEMFKEIQMDQDDRITSIIKSTVLLKKLYSDLADGENHYYKCLMDDLLMLFKVLPLKSDKFFYIIYRSVIENLVRVLLRYGDNNDTGVRKMFEGMKGENEIYYEYLNGEYGKCCNYVHSNISSKTNFYAYFEEILIEERLQKTSSLYEKLITFFSKFKAYISRYCFKEVYSVFRNHGEVLNYLLGDSYYAEYKKNMQVI